MQSPKAHLKYFPYAQDQCNKIKIVKDRSKLILSLVTSVIVFLKKINANHKSTVNAHSSIKKTMQKFLKKSDDLDALETRIINYSEACLSGSANKLSDSTELLKKFNLQKAEIQKSIKNFDKEAQNHFKRISRVRQELLDLVDDEKPAKKGTEMDPWLTQRLVTYNYPDALKKENEYQTIMMELIQKMVALDAKVISEFETVLTKYEAQIAPAGVAKPPSNASVPFAEKHVLMDPALWTVDRTTHVPFEVPQHQKVDIVKQGILIRSPPKKKLKHARFVVTESGFLHCFKIKPFTSPKQRLALEKDDRVMDVIKRDTEELGFERKQPLYSLELKDIQLKSMQDCFVELQVVHASGCTTSKKVYPVGFGNPEEMKEWMSTLKLSFFTSPKEGSPDAASPVKKGQVAESEPKTDKDAKGASSAASPADSKASKTDATSDKTKEAQSPQPKATGEKAKSPEAKSPEAKSPEAKSPTKTPVASA